MGKKTLWAQLTIFLGFIALFFVLNLIKPDVEFSDRENRYLQQRPEFSFDSLFSGKFTTDFETYVTDQFTLRDSWTTLKARCELLIGKQANKGVYLCDNETLIEGLKTPAQDKLDANTDALNALVEKAGVPVYFSLVPGKSEILSGLLPKNAPNYDGREMIKYCYGRSNAVNVDLLSPLSEHAQDYIYYRTDHHWTSLGAYYAYAALMASMGRDAAPLESYSPVTVSDEFFGTTYSSSGFSWIAPDSIQTFVDPPEGLSILNYPQGTPVDGKLYDFDFLEKKDKYSMFLGGNSPLQQISTGTPDAPSLLVIRDSYTDSLAPFLLKDFSEVHLIDLRYYRASLTQYIEENDIDVVLVCYALTSFSTDANLFLLGR
ncbi:MAG: DHHW family protein [Oscillospiraceae bacterium]